MNVNSELVVLPELAECGLISYWRLSGSISLELLAQAWKKLSLDSKLLPKPPGDEVALGRAVRDQASKRRLVRPLSKHGAWAIVDETVVGDQLDYTTILGIVYTENGPRYDRYALDAQSGGIAAIVAADYARHRSELSPVDISSWLIKLAGSNNAVTLRDTGGIYFVPRTNVPFWRSVVSAVESVSSHRVFKIPAMKNSEAIDAITEAVTAEATRLVATMEEELQQTGDDALGDRALVTRANACRALLAKVQSYEELLGVQMSKVVERVEGLQGSIAAAALLVGAEGDQAA